MILVLRALGVGDLLTGVPALRALRNAFPGQTLALAAPTWLTPLITLIGGIDRIVPVSGLEAGSLPPYSLMVPPASPPAALAVPRGSAPASSAAQPGSALPSLAVPRGSAPSSLPVPPISLAVNLHGSGPESHRLLQAAAPDRLWAFACRAAGHHDGPAWEEEEHEVQRWCRLLAHYGVPADPSDLSLLSPVGAGEPQASIIHPGAKSPSRRWPVERYAAVAKGLVAEGHRVVITGSEAERDLAVRVAERAGLGKSAVPHTGLGELAVLVAGARVVISGDTGIAHLASAYRTPSVVLFGPMSPERWGPPDRPQHRAIWHGTRSEPGDSPEPGVHPALLAIEPGEVLDAAREVTGAAAAL